VCSLSSFVRADTLQQAVNANNVSGVKAALAKDPKSVNQADRNGNTPLFISIQRGNATIFKLILDHKPNLAHQDRYGYTALHWATFNNRLEFAKTLIKNGADIGAKDKNGTTCLQHALNRQMYNYRNNGKHIVEVFLVSVKPKDTLPNGERPLLYAARHGYEDAVRQMLKLKADPSITDKNKRTPLEWALIGNHGKVANLLIPLVDVAKYKTTTGDSLLHWSASNGLTASVVSLVKRNAKVDELNADRATPLQLAVWNGHAETVKALIQAKAKIDTKDSSGQSTLHGAAWNGHKEVVKVLLDSGADVNAAVNGYTALHAAAWNGHVEVVRGLLAKRAKVSAQDSDGSTPLHKAAWRGHLDVVRALLQSKANPDIKDTDGFTALDKAKDAKRTAVIKALSSS
jgi:cytohesin